MNTKLQFRQNKKRVLLTNKKPYQIALILLVQLVFSNILTAQVSGTITGKVLDEQGESMIGVNILVKNTLKGTVTDFDGNFNISANKSDTLIFRFIGYVTENIPIAGNNVVDLQMKLNATDLDEYVIVGYGEVKRANLLGAVASIDAVDLQDIPATTLTSLFEGRMAGVYVQPAQPTGLPGADNRVIVRQGETTFGNTSDGGVKNPEPLYIIDGIEVSQSEFDVLDPTDVESISVLKDASAAVYGSKGANGVVLIRTKRGKEGKVSISYNGSYGVGDATQQTDMLSAYDQARMLNDMNRLNTNPDYTPISDEELAEMRNLNYNWLDDAWKTSVISRHTLSIRGGTENIKYSASGSYAYESGNFDRLDVTRYSYRIGLDIKIIEGLTTNITMSLDNKERDIPYVNGEQNTFSGLFENLLQAPKWKPAYIDGLPVGNDLDYNGLAQFNSGGFRQSQNKGNRVDARLRYEIPWVKGLSASASYSRRETNSYSKQYRVPYEIYEFEGVEGYQLLLSDKVESSTTVDEGADSRISESYGYGANYQVNTSINYTNSFGLHSISAFVNYEQYEASGTGFSATSYDMQIANLLTQQAFLFENALAESSLSESGRIAGIGRFNYSYADKYLLETAFRTEGTTKFAPGQRGGLFPSLAVGWVLSEENFFKDNVNFINFLKFRYSFGITGFSAIADYEYRYNFAPDAGGSYLFGSGYIGSAMSYAGKTDVVSTGASWEKSKMNNWGMDLKMFKNKLNITVDAFYNYQYDILEQVSPTLAGTAGISTMPSDNYGELKSWGYDASIGYRGNISKDFSWDIQANFGFATNRIVKKIVDSSYDNPLDYRYPIGKSTYNSEGTPEQGYITEGIIRTQGQLDAIQTYWNETYGRDYKPFGAEAGLGMLYYQDVGRAGDSSKGEPRYVAEPDGVVDEYDEVYIQKVNDSFVAKNLLPTSSVIGLKWKNLAVSSVWTFAWGVNSTMVDKLALSAPTYEENAPAFWADYYSSTNTDAKYPDPLYADLNKKKSSFWMRDIYSVRLQTLNVSYSLPKQICDNIGLSNIRVYFTGKNIWTPVSTFDYKEDAIARFNTYPYLKTFSFGLNASL